MLLINVSYNSNTCPFKEATVSKGSKTHTNLDNSRATGAISPAAPGPP